jgi:selenocysteine-specific elongation factor
MRLVGRQQLEPGRRCYVRALCEEPVATLPGQHFILRGFAPIAQRGTTIGGGRILAVLPPRRSRRQLTQWLTELERLDTGTLAERLEVQLDRAGSRGLDVAEMAMHTGAGPRQVHRELERLLAVRRVFKYDREGNRHVSATEIERLAERARERLAAFHQANPLLPGMPAEQLRGSLDAPVGPKLFRLLLAELERAGQARAQADRVRLAEHEVRLDAADARLEQQLIGLFREAGLTPPRLAEAAERLDRPAAAVESLLQHLARTGVLTHLTGDLYIHNAPLQELEQQLVAHLEQHESIDTQTFKKMVGASRKHVIPLAEYFDRRKVTMRVGDRRLLRGQGRANKPKPPRPQDGG